MSRVFPFSNILTWYQQNGRHNLPWRQVYDLPTKDRLYRVWIAEVMLQQTQVDRVIGYYNRFLGKYPTIDSLAETTYDELFPYYQGLGYYGRARRMIELAKTVVEKYEGIFPDDFEKLRKLPGIGKYTAQALLAFGYDKPVLAMDANLQKIFGRYFFGTRTQLLLEKEVQELEKHLEASIKNPSPSTFSLPLLALSGRSINNALMDFGALASTNIEKLDVEKYPLLDCAWFQTKGNQEFIVKKTVKRSEKGAKLVVFLHENHKTYFSSHTNHYEPFLIEPTNKDDRRTVQDYFSVTYGLEVSVRPSFGSGVFEKIPVKLFHTQIQTGKFNGKHFGKEEKEGWMERNITD